MLRCVLVPLLFTACSAAPGPKVLARMGAQCLADADCGSRTCRRGACTAECSAQRDCPFGFDCLQAAPEDSVPTCVPAAYEMPAEGGFGTECPLAAGGCTSEPSPCAEGFECLASVKCDANAYCSRACSTDAECPPAFFCGATKVGAGRQMRCLKRGACSPCVVDDQCPDGSLCDTGPDGSRHCAQICRLPADCAHALLDDNGVRYPPFEVCGPEGSGRAVKTCNPVGGLCAGPSAVAGIDGEGQVCSGCRPGLSDCASGLGCWVGSSGERFCTRKCTVNLSRGGSGYQVSGDNCPAKTFCFFGGQVPGNCGAACAVEGLCAGDPTYSQATCHPPSN